MPRRVAQYIILCEDLQSQVFARRYLLARNIPERKIFTRRLPLARGGAGDSYVLAQYAVEVRNLRRRPKNDIRLVVLIDADSHTCAERFTHLAAQLKNSNEVERVLNAGIAIFVPKRNIETWVHYIAGETVDEEQVYHKFRGRKAQYAKNVYRLATHICPHGLPDNAPPSLQAACDELRRIL